MKNDPHAFIRLFPSRKILVVGDIMLDEYIEGSAERISPEAPIPVLLQKNVRHVLGGAGNVAANAAALGGKVTLVGVVGRDTRAKTLSRLAREKRITPKFLPDASRPTTTKIRFVSGHHQLVRIDIEEARPLAPMSERKLIAIIRALPKHDIVIVSDYAKGCITKNVLAALRARFGADKIVADMKPVNALHYRGILAVTPNVKEATEMCGVHASDDVHAEQAAALIAKRLKTGVLLTRGEHGVTARAHGERKSAHFRAQVHTVRDVTGAGDTLIAAFALMIASGAAFLEAGELANRAAGIVVGVSGTHALTRKELLDIFTAVSAAR